MNGNIWERADSSAKQERLSQPGRESLRPIWGQGGVLHSRRMIAEADGGGMPVSFGSF